jgi:hypothetical protein
MKEKYRINGTYLVADVIDGVSIHGAVDYPDVDILSPRIFYECLADLGDDEVIYTYVGGDDEELFDKIDKEYGINQPEQTTVKGDTMTTECKAIADGKRIQFIISKQDPGYENFAKVLTSIEKHGSFGWYGDVRDSEGKESNGLVLTFTTAKSKWKISTNVQPNVYSFATKEEAKERFDSMVAGTDSYDWRQEGGLSIVEVHEVCEP